MPLFHGSMYGFAWISADHTVPCMDTYGNQECHGFMEIPTFGFRFMLYSGLGAVLI